jgi:hypothetical protein
MIMTIEERTTMTNEYEQDPLIPGAYDKNKYDYLHCDLEMAWSYVTWKVDADCTCDFCRMSHLYDRATKAGIRFMAEMDYDDVEESLASFDTPPR